MTRAPEPASDRTAPADEIDLRALGLALKRRRRTVVLPTLLAFALITIGVNVMTPRYTAETQVLLENQETVFTRPDRANLPPDAATQVDQEAVASQVQLINSRDIAHRAIEALGLAGDPEFDPLARGMGPVKRVLVLLGLAHDPTRDSADARIVQTFLEKLTVYSPSKTRVISVQFTSADPELAARAANTVAELYLQEQSSAKRAGAKDAADALGAQIADLRVKLAAADAEREQYRSQSDLLAGTNNMTISGQQLADINTDLSKARTTQADAQAKASMIRELLRSGKAADVTEVINNDIVRRVSDQRVTAQAQLALESRTLLPGHPRIKELTAQVAQYDLALKIAAKQAATTLENEAKIAGQRVVNLEAVLTQQKKVAGIANTDEVHLRALERNAQSLKDQLESSTTKYQEALARESSTATPADARIISRAARPQEPSFPKKLPFIVFGTVATFVFSLGFVIAGELLSGRAVVVASPIETAASERVAPVVPMPASRRPPVPEVARRFFPRIRLKPRRWFGAKADHQPDLTFAPIDVVPRRRRALLDVKSFLPGSLMGSAMDRLKAFGRSAAASRPTDVAEVAERDIAAEGVGWNADQRVAQPEVRVAMPPIGGAVDPALAERIVSAHVPGRGLNVVGTSLGNETGATGVLIDLSRMLAEKGRAIIVDLNRTPMKLAPLAGANGDGRTKVMTMNGLSELLSGDSSFAEVINRDLASRLHYIPTGRQEADFRDFDLILDALAETYDFIVLLTPAFPQSEIAKVMAPYADFVVLAAVAAPDDETVSALERELIEAGAHEILVAGRSVRDTSRTKDVA